jgi:hypothetical protein
VPNRGLEWRTRRDAKITMIFKLLQGKTWEEKCALAFGEILVDNNKVSSRS